jgi:hypothetical protein
LAFHPHPQLIQRFFNTNWFGPPPRVTGGSAWPWIDHSASGLPRATGTRCSHSLSLRLRHRLGLAARDNSQAHYAKGTRSPGQARLPQLEGGWFQVLFHSPRGVLFTFPSRYWCAIGRQGVFSLGGWALRIQTGFHVSRPTWVPESSPRNCMQGAVTRCGAASQRLALILEQPDTGPATPGGQAPRFGLFRVRSPLLAESLLFSSPPGTEMFHFPGCSLPHLFDSMRDGTLFTGAGLLHSEIRGSKAACAYPRLIAACRVLHRLLSPRHPPSARTAWPPENDRAPNPTDGVPHGLRGHE